MVATPRPRATRERKLITQKEVATLLEPIPRSILDAAGLDGDDLRRLL